MIHYHSKTVREFYRKCSCDSWICLWNFKKYLYNVGKCSGSFRKMHCAIQEMFKVYLKYYACIQKKFKHVFEKKINHVLEKCSTCIKNMLCMYTKSIKHVLR